MSFFSRKKSQGEAPPGRDASVTLVLLLEGAPPADPDEVRIMIRNADAELAGASIDLLPETFAQKTPYGEIKYGPHKVRLVGFDAPMPESAWRDALQAGNFDQSVKRRAAAHRSHLLLFHEGSAVDPLERYVALATIACALAEFGGVVVVNPAGLTSMPSIRASDLDGGVVADTWRSLPLTTLFIGFVKYDTGGDGVWMRTHGAEVFGLPDLATLQASHEQGQESFEMFSDILAYARGGPKLKAGETLQMGSATAPMMRFRSPHKSETWLRSPGEMLVIELGARGR